MNIKMLAAIAIALAGLSSSMARADEHQLRGRGGDWHDGRGYAGHWGHERRGYEGYRGPHWDYGYAPRHYVPHYYAPRMYAPAYYAPGYYAPAYPVARVDDLGFAIQLRLP